MASNEDIETPIPEGILQGHDEVIVEDDEPVIRHTDRSSFFSFVPELGAYGAGIVAGEVSLATRAVVNGPGFLAGFLKETVDFYSENPRTLYDEVISGFTVAIMQVPESIAFSFVAGVPPLSGLHATFWMATITGIFGGKPGMISGAAGALAVVVDELTLDTGVLKYLSKDERLNVLYMTMFVCGLMQIFAAWLRLAKAIRLIPDTGMIGFMNGLAIIIFSAQLPAFQKCPVEGLEYFVDCKVSEREWLTFSDDTAMLILSLVHVAVTMFIMKFYVLVPVVGKMVPASLVSLLMGTFLEHVIFRPILDTETRTVAQTAPMSGSLPKFSWPSIPMSDVDYEGTIYTSSDTIATIINYGITLAAIGGVESVLTLQACNEITDTVPKVSDSNQELAAQGLANLVCGLFRAMGGDAMIGQSTINIMNGARHRVSSTTSGLFMLLFVVAISPFIELLPIATLTGVLFMIVLNTFQWQTFEILRYGRLSDSAVILIVTLVAVFFNLAVAIVAGVCFSALVYAWDSGGLVDANIEVKPMLVNGEEKTVKYVNVRGAIFFGSVREFIAMFNVANDPEVIVIDLKNAIIVDHSAVAAIGGVTHRFAQAEKKVYLTNVPHKCVGRLHRTGDHDVLADQMKHESHFEDTKPVITLSALPMFSPHVEQVDDELYKLEDEQGVFTIGELAEKIAVKLVDDVKKESFNETKKDS